MEEEWKICKNYKNYSASNQGRIRNDYTKKILNMKPNNTGYLTLCLTNDNGKKIHTGVHRLIAETWIPNPENKQTINHKNKNKLDNRVENLEWATHREQNIHKLQGDEKIKKNNRGIWKCDIITGEKIKYYDTIAEAEKDLNLVGSTGNISLCANGKINYVYGYKWKYDEKKLYDKKIDDLEGEEWKLIIDNYYISNQGRLRNGNRLLTLSEHNGYYCYNLKRKQQRVHRLVAEKFVDNPKNLKIVNHINGNKLDNKYTNLEWCTHTENVNHAIKMGLKKNVKKVIQFDKDNNIISMFDSCVDAERKLGINQSNINMCCKGKSNIYDKDKNKLFFKFLEDTDDLINKKIDDSNIKFKPKKIRVESIKRKINVYDKKGNLLEICKSRLDASKKYKVNRNTITKYCNNEVKYKNCDYDFSYTDD